MIVPPTKTYENVYLAPGRYGVAMNFIHSSRVAHFSVLAPPGPAWAGSLMGTSIFAILCHVHAVAYLPGLLLAIAVGALVFIVFGWLWFRNPKWHSHLMPPWGMFAMGLLAIGSAATAVTGQLGWQVASWWIATPLAIVVCGLQLRGFPGAPTFQWGLALVAPMVAATSGGQLSHEVAGGVGGWHMWYDYAGLFCFVLTLVTALPIFTRCYLEAVRGRLVIPRTLAGTAWIPLGVVGQSTAAAQVLFPGRIAVIYGFFMLLAGIVPAIYAFFHFLRAVVSWAGYSPGWWGSTFPVGTLSLGSHLLALSTGFGWLNIISMVLLGLLAVHWTCCVTRFGAWFLGGMIHPQRQEGAAA